MTSVTALSIKVDERDNVAIIVNGDGARAGSRLTDGTELLHDVPQGHKVALQYIARGQAIVRYGETIGFALDDIARGSWIDENMLRLPEAPALASLPLSTRRTVRSDPLEGYTFEGYRNPDGSVGTKNVLAISTSVQCVAGVAEQHVVAGPAIEPVVAATAGETVVT